MDRRRKQEMNDKKKKKKKKNENERGEQIGEGGKQFIQNFSGTFLEH